MLVMKSLSALPPSSWLNPGVSLKRTDTEACRICHLRSFYLGLQALLFAQSGSLGELYSARFFFLPALNEWSQCYQEILQNRMEAPHILHFSILLSLLAQLAILNKLDKKKDKRSDYSTKIMTLPWRCHGAAGGSLRRTAALYDPTQSSA